MINDISELNLPQDILDNDIQMELIKKALFVKSCEIMYPKIKEKIKDYPIAKTTLNPNSKAVKFRNFLEFIEHFDLKLRVKILNSGVSVKINTGMIWVNILSIRAPRLKNNNIHCNLSFNSLRNDSDLIDIPFKIEPFLNYYRIMNITIEQIMDVLNRDLLKHLIKKAYRN